MLRIEDVLDRDYTNEEYQQIDQQLFLKNGGDPDFNPEKNKAVFEYVKRKAWENHQKRKKQYDEKLRERMNAAASYILYLERGGNGGNKAEKYFGKRELARLRGVEFLNEMRNVSIVQVPGYRKQREVNRQNARIKKA